MRTIRSDHHVISSYETNKTSLSCFDDKRYIHNDGITSYAYGWLPQAAQSKREDLGAWDKHLDS